jgi:hypothetical protein
MRAQDAVIWHMEQPTNPLTITGVVILGAPVESDRLQIIVEQRLLGIDRFRRL